MGILDGLYRVLMRRNSVYVTFVVAGAFAGERVGTLPIGSSPPLGSASYSYLLGFFWLAI
ncbi:hypothetical protein COCNU_02G016540 [Cocos nucifera]|uniref:Complex III subunit 9 n=1 Tax=Cocos nucifera TaxID=13894 RepID=A0A8K0MXH4_COCNU|nr:hypothetical protein COCNU_02G016540 [Cocos nucifera]